MKRIRSQQRVKKKLEAKSSKVPVADLGRNSSGWSVKSNRANQGAEGVDYALNPCVGCRRRRFSAVADKSFDHAHDKPSCSVALDARVKRSPLNILVAIESEPALQRGVGSFFFPNIADLLYNGPAQQVGGRGEGTPLVLPGLLLSP
jgi:hypothetical protein